MNWNDCWKWHERASIARVTLLSRLPPNPHFRPSTPYSLAPTRDEQRPTVPGCSPSIAIVFVCCTTTNSHTLNIKHSPIISHYSYWTQSPPTLYSFITVKIGLCEFFWGGGVTLRPTLLLSFTNNNKPIYSNICKSKA